MREKPEKNRRIELVAPAGSVQKMSTAFLYGADAVYLGIPDFSLRVRINDFTLKSLANAVKSAHDFGKKAYITINIFAHNKHLDKLPVYLKLLNKLKVDALIISDPGIINLAKKYAPKIPIHLSTQANCTNYQAARFWYEQGIKQIVLGRETTLTEIREIKAKCPKLELEYFAHGAMCMAYSGRCFLSKEMAGRSANEGDCVQPCRWQYNEVFLKSQGHDEILELVKEKHGSYLLNSKDLCLIEYLPQLIAAGVTAFKIEGRAKSVYYLANVVGIYRRALEASQNLAGNKLQSELSFLADELKTKIINRGYTTGFLLGPKRDEKIKMQNQADSKQASDWEFCGQVISSKDGQLRLTVHNTLRIGDKVELILPGYKIIPFAIKNIISAKTKEILTEAHGGAGRQEVLIEAPAGVLAPKGAMLRRLVSI